MPIRKNDNIQFVGRYLAGGTVNPINDGSFTWLLTDKYGRIITGDIIPTGAIVNQLIPPVATPTQLTYPIVWRAIESVTIKALNSNANPVHIGFVNDNPALTNSNGYELMPNESVSISMFDLLNILVYTTNAGDGICYVAVIDSSLDP